MEIKNQIEVIKTLIATMEVTLAETIKELKGIKGDTVISDKIKKLAGDLLEVYEVEILKVCSIIEAGSIADIKNTEDTIKFMKAEIVIQKNKLKKLEKMEAEYNEMMGILPDKADKVGEEVGAEGTGAETGK